jgi:hypothetical protein
MCLARDWHQSISQSNHNLVPDGRIGMQKSFSHRDTASVDAILSVMYTGVAETLPNRPIVIKTVGVSTLFQILELNLYLLNSSLTKWGSGF